MASHDFRIVSADRYRTVAEARIVEFLLSPYEIAAGARELDVPVAKDILERLIALGLPYALSQDGRRLFDPAEVQNFIKSAYLRWNEPIWPVRAVMMLRRLMSPSASYTSVDFPPDLSELNSKTYLVTIVRKFNLAKHRVGDVVRLRLPLPIEDRMLRHSVSSFLPLSAYDVQASFDEARLDIKYVVTECKSVEIGVRILFEANSKTDKLSAKIDNDERAIYTSGSEGLIKINQRVIDLSKRLAREKTGNLNLLHSVWDFMFDDLSLGVIHYDKIDPANPLDWTLDNHVYDCLVGSALIVALCRAQGIPARMVSGYTLNPVLPTTHTWVEVWIDEKGWAPFDLYSMDLCGGDRDSPWRHHFFGQVDHRLVTERFPRKFSGLGSIRLPLAWQMVTAMHRDGAVTSFEDLATGDLVYSEKVSVIAAN